MKSLVLLIASSISLGGSHWSFDQIGRTALLTDPKLDDAPLQLSCAPFGLLQISILAGDAKEVSLERSSKITLTIRGDHTADGRVVSKVFFESITVEFLKEEGEVAVSGGRSYQMHLDGAESAISRLKGACTTAS